MCPKKSKIVRRTFFSIASQLDATLFWFSFNCYDYFSTLRCITELLCDALRSEQFVVTHTTTTTTANIMLMLMLHITLSILFFVSFFEF